MNTVRMDSFRVAVGIVVLLVLHAIRTTHAQCDCGCIYEDTDSIDDCDYQCEKIRSSDMVTFQANLESELASNGGATFFRDAVPDPVPEVLVGTPICHIETKTILGYWKDDGATYCGVVDTSVQVINRASCDHQPCCGPDTQCEPCAYRDYFYLVWCDAFYAGGAAPTAPVLSIGVDDLSGAGRRRRDAEWPLQSNGTRRKRQTAGAYFAIRHDNFPTVCACQRCSC